jgi:hypothetical protein
VFAKVEAAGRADTKIGRAGRMGAFTTPGPKGGHYQDLGVCERDTLEEALAFCAHSQPQATPIRERAGERNVRPSTSHQGSSLVRQTGSQRSGKPIVDQPLVSACNPSTQEAEAEGSQV